MNRGQFYCWLVQQVEVAKNDVSRFEKYNVSLRDYAWQRYCILRNVLEKFEQGVINDEQIETD